MQGTPSAGAEGWPDPSELWQSWLRAFGLRAPLSGDVTQDIDPSLVRGTGDQLGLININTTRAGDPQLERRIVEQVASYGRQLGQLIDAVDVVIRRDAGEPLSPDDELALEQLQSLRSEIAATKERFAAEHVDRVVAQVRALRRHPGANEDALRRIRQALEEPEE